MTIEMMLKKLVPGLQGIYGSLLECIILYGSTARGMQTYESDMDVAILPHAGATKEMRSQMLDLVVDLELACRNILSVLCIDCEKFAEWKDTLAFYKNIWNVLWQAARQPCPRIASDGPKRNFKRRNSYYATPTSVRLSTADYERK